MTSKRTDLPTLTEIVELAQPADGSAPMQAPIPVQEESVALESDALEALQRDASRGVGVGFTQRAAPASRAPAAASADAAASALAHDEELVAQVMVRLQPRLEAWVESHVRYALLDLLPVWTESAALSIVRDLRAEMPELLSLALDEVHRHREEKRDG
jgi:hypothetical protein